MFDHCHLLYIGHHLHQLVDFTCIVARISTCVHCILVFCIGHQYISFGSCMFVHMIYKCLSARNDHVVFCDIFSVSSVVCFPIWCIPIHWHVIWLNHKYMYILHGHFNVTPSVPIWYDFPVNMMLITWPRQLWKQHTMPMWYTQASTWHFSWETCLTFLFAPEIQHTPQVIQQKWGVEATAGEQPWWCANHTPDFHQCAQCSQEVQSTE